MNENTKLALQVAATVVVCIAAANATRVALVLGTRYLARKQKESN